MNVRNASGLLLDGKRYFICFYLLFPFRLDLLYLSYPAQGLA